MKSLRRILLAIILLLGVAWFITTQPLFTIAKSPDNDIIVDANLLKSHVITLAEKLPARGGFEKSLKPTQQWIEQQVQGFGKITRQSYKVGDETFYNILMDFGPPLSESTKSEGIIIVGAHYDTAHSFPGADDNASGVAVLIELARLLSKNEALLKSHIQLAFYTLEEPPYFRTQKMGSFIHASRLKEKQQKVKLMIALDMVGYFSDKKNSQHFPIPFMEKLYSDQGNFIAVVGNLSNMLAVRTVKSGMMSGTKLPIYSINAPTLIQGIDFSDHLNFWHFSYPAVLVTDTSFMRNTTYHTKQDTADRLNYEKMAEVVKGLYQVVTQ